MEWITIKEAITLVNKSNQAIYKLSTKEEYKKHFKVSNGSKYVDKDFIVNYYNHKITGELKPTEVIQKYSEEIIKEQKETIENIKKDKEEIIRELKETIENLKKDKENLQNDKEELYKQLSVKDNQIESLTNNYQATLQLLNQQQQLQYQSVEKISAPTEDKTQEQQQDITITEKPKEEKKGFFSFFSRK